MSRGFIKEGDQEEIPMVPPRAYLPEGVPNYVTKEVLAALNEELAILQAELAKAGDNYIMSNFIEAKMKLLIGRINSAVEVDLSKANKGVMSFGAWVRYNGRVVRIVGVDEADINKGLISFTSPLAKILLGKKAGDVFELKGPKGMEKITVEEVSFEPMALTPLVSEKPSEALVTAEKKSQGTIKKTTVLIDTKQEETIEDSPDQIVNTNEARLFVPEENPMEFLPIVNERGNIMGRALYLELHNGNKMLHPVAHLHVLNEKGEVVRRYWWHVAFGDTPEKTLQRKMAEVLGLSGVKPRLKRQYIRESKTEEELPKTTEVKDYLEVFAKD